MLTWFSADCCRAETLKQSSYSAWAEAGGHNSSNTWSLKIAFNLAVKACKKTLRRARFSHISRIGAKLAS